MLNVCWFSKSLRVKLRAVHQLSVPREYRLLCTGYQYQGRSLEPSNPLHLCIWVTKDKTGSQALKFCGTPKNTIFCQSDNNKKNRYNFDSFTPDSYCCVGCCHFLIGQSKGKECAWLNSQVLHILKILVVHWLKIAGIQDKWVLTNP